MVGTVPLPDMGTAEELLNSRCIMLGVGLVRMLAALDANKRELKISIKLGNNSNL